MIFILPTQSTSEFLNLKPKSSTLQLPKLFFGLIDLPDTGTAYHSVKSFTEKSKSSLLCRQSQASKGTTGISYQLQS